MKKDKEIIMISAASEALKYKNANPKMNSERIIQHVMSFFNLAIDLKISAIAAVNESIKIKEKNPNFTDRQVLQELMNNIEKVLMQIQKSR